MTENTFTDMHKIFDENIKRIRSGIENAAVKSGRSPEEITLLAATKTVPVFMVNYALKNGVTHIGENKVQEVLLKCGGLLPCEREFIGRLQTNKVKQLVGNVSRIQSVDTVKLAGCISEQSVKKGIKTQILVEVNIANEQSKGGVSPQELTDFLWEIKDLEGVEVNGLMTIPPICEDETRLRGYFLKMRQYYVDITAKKIDNIHMKCLSMGMSSDFEMAIECGATLVRIGSALFGERN